MRVSPAGFGYMTALLAAAAHETPLVVLLEGGYFLPAIAECAHATVRALLDRVGAAIL